MRGAPGLDLGGARRFLGGGIFSLDVGRLSARAEYVRVMLDDHCQVDASRRVGRGHVVCIHKY